MVWIDYSDSRPIYEQIVARYKNLIVKGAMKPDEKMPSVRSLAMDLSINPNTIQKAYAELERQGFIHSVKGKGNFVSGNTELKKQKEQEILEALDIVLKEAKDANIELAVLEKHIQKCMKKEV